MNKNFVTFVVLGLIFIFSGCNSQPNSVVPVAELPLEVIETETVTQTPIPSTITPVPATETPVPTSTITPTITPLPVPLCFQQDFSLYFETSPATEGMKWFAEQNGLTLKYIYFPKICSPEIIEQDIQLLFYSDYIKEDEIGFMILDEWYSGTLGVLYNHLSLYDFWAMGPEDYPLLLEKTEGVETNLIIFRADRIYGEGNEGNAILGLMQGMAEHEYIHTVQGRNNPDLSDMIWNVGEYRAFIERYANLGNNSGHRYRMSSITYLLLLQFLDGINEQGKLYSETEKLLQAQGMSVDEFLNRDIALYTDNIYRQLISVADEAYVERLRNGEINPLQLVEFAGCGDLISYEILRHLYDENVASYNNWYYASNTEQYLPGTFAELFDPN